MTKIFFILMICFFALVLVFSDVQADIIRVPQQYSTIQQGINAAVDGDVVLVAPGTYYENINFLGKAITVKSVQGPEVTIINGNQNGSVVTFVNQEQLDSVIDGFTITNGSGTYSSPDGVSGGGVYSYWSTTTGSGPTIINNIITGNSVTGCGAGIYGCEFHGVMLNNIISNNSAGGNGGGIYLRDVRTTTTIEGNTITQNSSLGNGGGVEIGTDGTPNIRGNTITFNIAPGLGGGINIYSYTGAANLTIENNLITNNSTTSSSGSGGGISYYTANATISNNTITDNTAVYMGGGIYSWFAAGGIISNNKITNNSVINPSYSSGSGGGIACHNSSNPTILNNTITENFASSSGGGIFCWQYSSPIIEGNLISRNSTDLNYSWASGGGIKCSSNCNSTIKNNDIVENSAVYGGGIWSFGSSLQISNNLIYQNSAVNRGGGVLFWGTDLQHSFILTNNTLVNNSATDMGGGIYCEWICDVTQSNDILWNNNAPLGPEIALGWGMVDEITFTTSYSDIDGGQSQVYINPYSPNVTLNWGLGMINSDPLFTNPEVSHYSLNVGSPCIDIGNPAILDPDQTISNMGAYGGPEAKIVNLTLFTEAFQVPQGGTLEYTSLLSNNFSNNPRVFYGTEVILPDGRIHADNPVSINLNSYQTIEHQDALAIPNNALLGDYVYVGKVGTREDGIIDESSFNFEVTN